MMRIYEKSNISIVSMIDLYICARFHRDDDIIKMDLQWSQNNWMKSNKSEIKNRTFDVPYIFIMKKKKYVDE